MTCHDHDTACMQLNAKAHAKGWPLRADCSCAFSRRELGALHEVWAAAAAGGVPARAALDMRKLKPFARNIVIMEKTDVASGSGYRFRLFGSALAALFGEHTGHSLDEMVLPQMLPGWVAFYDAILSARRPVRLINYYRLPNDGFLKGEIFAAPLADDAGAVRMVLAATYVDFKDYTLSPFVQTGPVA